MFASITKLFKRPQGKPAPKLAPRQPVLSVVKPAPSRQAEQSEPAEMEEDDGRLGISFTSLMKSVPGELHGKKASPEMLTGKFFIPRQLVIDQLGKGAVRVKFGEIRRSAPPGVFINASGEDSRSIELPLAEVLPQLKPEEMQRRTQHRMEVPDDISNLFGSEQGLSSMRVLAKAETTIVARKSAPATPAVPSTTGGAGGARKAAASPASPQRSVTPSRAIPAAPITRAPVQPKITPPANLAAAVAAPVVRPVVPAPKDDGKVISVSLTELSVKWPENVQREIKSSSLVNAVCELPAAELTRSLKQGKVELPWKVIRSWLKPRVNGPSALGETVLQLPLEVLAPIFLAQNQGGGGQRKVEIAPEIPDIFNRTGIITPPPAPISLPAPKTETTLKSRSEAAPIARTETAFMTRSEAAVIAKRSDTAHRTRSDTAMRARPLEPATGPVPISLSLLAATWPPNLVKEFDTSFLAQAKLEIPVEALEPGMRMGKVDFLWKQLCGWLVPTAPPAVIAAHADTRIELPLSIVAPLFLQRKPDLQRDKRADIQVDVPDVFQAAPVSISAAAPALAAAPAIIADSPEMPGNTEIRRRIRDLADLFGQPEKRNWTPNEIVQKTGSLPGVAGALIALQDGLLVSSCMPPEWRTETIAAFLPQIFGRMHQYTKELNMGELQSVTFAVEKGALLIFAAGIIYFAVLSKPETSLPLHELTLIARELSRHTK